MKKLKILIVEDDKNSQLILSLYLEDFATAIIIAENGLEGVEYCRKHSDIDLIMMDKNMPKMNGHEATKAIREFNKEVVIIEQTAYGLPEDIKKSLSLGFNYHMSKPVNKNLLTKILETEFSEMNFK